MIDYVSGSQPLCRGTVVCHWLPPSAPQDCKIMSYNEFFPIIYSVCVPHKLFWRFKCAAEKKLPLGVPQAKKG